MKYVRATVSSNGVTCFLCLYSFIVTLPCRKNTLHLQMELLCIHRYLARHLRHETKNLGSNANILLFHKMTGRNPAVHIKAKKASNSIWLHVFPTSNHQRLSRSDMPQLLSPSSVLANSSNLSVKHSFLWQNLI